MLVALLVVLLTLGVTEAGPLPQGVNPASAHLYKPESGQFTCADGSQSMPYERVNDNFCDCIDGSDEPGTSACPNGKFYCHNRGHEAKLISSSFVDDGMCDCCDGSEEPDGTCANKCLELSAPAFEALKHAVEVYGAALQQRPAYVHKSNARRNEWAERIHTIGGDLEAKQMELHAALELKHMAELENAQLLQAQQQDKNEQQRRSLQQDGSQGQDQQQQQGQADDSAAHESSGAASAQGETAEERGRRIASQWTSDPAASASRPQSGQQYLRGQQQAPGSPPPRRPTRRERKMAGEQLTEWEEFLMFVDLLGQYFSGWGRWLSMVLREGIKRDVLERREKAKLRRQQLMDRFHQQMHLPQQPALAARTAISEHEMTDTLREAIQHASEVESQLHALRREQADILRFSRGDFQWGDDGVFFSFAGRCFEDTSNTQWTYELCFYDGAVQKPKYGNGGMSRLGTWRGFFVLPDDTKFMAVIDGGEACSAGIARNLKVSMECGEGDSLHDTVETSLCSYESQFVTPAACSEAEYQRLSSALATIQKQREELRAEIEAGIRHHDEL